MINKPNLITCLVLLVVLILCCGFVSLAVSNMPEIETGLPPINATNFKDYLTKKSFICTTDPKSVSCSLDTASYQINIFYGKNENDQITSFTNDVQSKSVPIKDNKELLALTSKINRYLLSLNTEFQTRAMTNIDYAMSSDTPMRDIVENAISIHLEGTSTRKILTATKTK